MINYQFQYFWIFRSVLCLFVKFFERKIHLCLLVNFVLLPTALILPNQQRSVKISIVQILLCKALSLCFSSCNCNIWRLLMNLQISSFSPRISKTWKFPKGEEKREVSIVSLCISVSLDWLIWIEFSIKKEPAYWSREDQWINSPCIKKSFLARLNCSELAKESPAGASF